MILEILTFITINLIIVLFYMAEKTINVFTSENIYSFIIILFGIPCFYLGVFFDSGFITLLVWIVLSVLTVLFMDRSIK